MKLVSFAFVLLILAGCGGGDPLPEGMKNTDPIDCNARPELCI